LISYSKFISIEFSLVKELCNEIEKYKPLKALRLEGNTINEEAATAIGKALEKHSEIQVNNSHRFFLLNYFSIRSD
jgi:Ran GTPase-activating protein (RanGAP) involved in mRNA processing and transport